MKFGTTDIEKAYFGTNELSRIYYGTTLVYDGSSTQPAGIDEHTLACYHFDEPVGSEASTKCYDSVRNLSFALCNDVTSVVSDTYAKFGDRSLNCQSEPGCFSFGLSTTHDWTVDNWVRTDTSGFYHGTGEYYARNVGPIYFHGVFFDITNNAIKIINTNNSGQPTTISTTSYTFPSSTWVHLATSRDITNGKTYVFVDGEKVVEVADTVENRGNGFVVAGASSCWIDELRFSDNVRYTDDFSVPTQAYTREDAFKDQFLKIGSPTAIKTIASNFSENDYLVTNNAFNPGNSTWELHTKVKTSTDITSSGTYFFGSITGGTRSILLGWTNGIFRFYLSSNGTAWDIASKKGTYAISNDIEYYLNLSFDGSTYELKVSTDGLNWTSGGTVSSSTPIIGSLMYLGACWDPSIAHLKANGYIDLSCTYFKVGSQVTPLLGNYTVVGNPTLSADAFTDFSNAKYITTGNVFRNTTSSFELHTAINLTELRTDNTNYGVIDSGLPIWGRGSSFTDKNVRLTVLNNKLNFRVSTTNGRDYQISFQSINDLQLYTKLYIKATYSPADGYRLYSSPDDSTWTLEGSSYSTTSAPYNSSYGNIAIGTNSDMSVNFPFLGIIYLEDTYIKIDDVTVWKPYYSKETPIYNVGTPDFVMKFDGNFDYYSNGNITASLVNTPKLTTGGPWDNGALDQTYNSVDTSIKKSVRLNANKSVWQNQNFFIEFFVKLQNLDQSIYQTFLGNMEHPDSTYNGWAYRWGVSYSAMDAICACYGSLQHSISELPSGSTDRTVWQQKTSTTNWAHYGIFVCSEPGSLNYGTAWILGNGVLHQLNTTWYDFFVEGGLNDILIGNAKYGTGYTLSPIAEVRILTGENAENYFYEIQGGFYPDSERLIEYNAPTGSFSTTGLTKYTAQPES